MKKLIALILLVFVAFTSFSQEVQYECESLKTKMKNLPYQYVVDGNTIKFQEIFELTNGLSKEQLYNIAKQFIISSYGDANRVIQLDDKEAGKLVTKGLFAEVYCSCSDVVFTGSAMEYTATHILQIDVKDNRARVTVTITAIKQKSGGTGYGTAYYVPLKYIDFTPIQFYPFSTDCTVWSNNHAMNWYPKEGSQKQFKGNYHEGMVLYNVMLRSNETILALNKAFTSTTTVQNVSDEW